MARLHWKLSKITYLFDNLTYLACEDHAAEATNAGTSSDWKSEWHSTGSEGAIKLLCDYCQNLDPKL